MPLNPKLFQMGAKTWRDPVTHAKFVEEEKTKLSLDKKRKDVEEFAKEVEAERSKLTREKVAQTGRLLIENKQDEYLAKLKADVARLEAKKDGKSLDPSVAIAAFNAAAIANQAREREGFVGKETKLTAQEMLKIQEKELEDNKKKVEKELEQLAERRRRELLEYKHALGLSSSNTRQPPQRPKRFPNRPLSLHDDPEFWKLSDEDQHLLETMSPDTRAREYGFGPYEEDEVEYDPELQQRFERLGVGASMLAEKGLGQLNEQQLMEKMKRFICTEHSNVPGLLRHFPPISLTFPLDVHPPAAYEGADRLTIEQILRESSFALRDELCKAAIIQHGANALLELRVEGPFPVDGEEATAQGIVSELVAQGVPARVDPSLAHGGVAHGGGKNVRFAGHGGHQRQHPGGGNGLLGSHGGGAGWGGSGRDWALFGEGEGGGGAGWGGAGGWGEGIMPVTWEGGGGGWGGNAAGQDQSNPWGTGQDAGGWDSRGNNGGLWGAGGQSGWPNFSGGGGGGAWQNWQGGAGGNGWTQGGGGQGDWDSSGGGGWGGNGGRLGGQYAGGWGANQGGMGRDQGAVWQGRLRGGQTTPRSKPQDLPFGAQMYIKKVRQQQEREMREMAAAAAAGLHPPAPHQASAPERSQPEPLGEDPALFGNAFTRSAFPFSPPPAADPVVPPATAAPVLGGPPGPTLGQHTYAAAPPPQPTQAVSPGPATGAGGLQGRIMSFFGGAPQPSVDPDHGGDGGPGGGNGANEGPAVAAGWQQPTVGVSTGSGAGGQGLDATAMNKLKGGHSW
ncbi:hypothetical protein JCM11251_000953 [Rhodosporidiobolus azoricus]